MLVHHYRRLGSPISGLIAPWMAALGPVYALVDVLSAASPYT